MHRQRDKDPTEFFSVVGAPYVRESHIGGFDLCERDVDAPRSRRFKIGLATLGAGLGALLLGISLFASDGAARLTEVAYQAITMK